MAKWKVKPGVVQGTLAGSIEYDRNQSVHDSTWQVYQDERPFLEQAKMERETHNKNGVGGMKKFATVPDIVAMEILHKFGLDIHSPEFMHDPDGLKKLKYLITTEYPYLLSN